MSFIAELERLAELRRSGGLTDEEYATANVIVLGENPRSNVKTAPFLSKTDPNRSKTGPFLDAPSPFPTGRRPE